MDFEAFKKKLKLRYTFGMNRSDGASRRYTDSEMKIGAELHTPKDKYGKWGKGEYSYYMENKTETFDTLEELFKFYKGELT